MKKSVPHLFADVTALLEDMHGIAVEGQQAHLSADMYAVLTWQLRAGAVRLDEITAEIAFALGPLQ